MSRHLIVHHFIPLFARAKGTCRSSRPGWAALMVSPLFLALASCQSSQYVLPTADERAGLEQSIIAETVILAAVPLTEAAIYPVLDALLAEHPDAYGSTFALDPASAGSPLAPYAYRASGKIAHRSLASASYDYPHQTWFSVPLKSGKPLWSEPYFDKGGGEVEMITFSAPVRKDGRIIGIITVDIELQTRK